MRPRTTPSRAFTLVELVVVIAILGILAAVAAPRWGDGVGRRRLDAAAGRIAADLQFARHLARTQSRTATVVFDVPASTYGIAGVRDPLTASSSYRVVLSESPYHVQVDSADFDGDSAIAFDAFGAADSPGSVVVSNTAGTRTIAIGAAAAGPVVTGGF